jgi:hypothetical protein
MVIQKAIYERLRAVARAGQTIYYGSVAELAGLDIHSQSDRKIIGRFLDDIDRYEYAHGRPMLSAVVIRERTGCPGKGFFDLARQIGVLNGRTTDAEFFSRELERVHTLWRHSPPDDGGHA